MVQRHIIPCLKLIYVLPFVGCIFWNLQNVTETFEIQDERKCISLPAIDVFKHAIKALKDHFEEAAKDRGVVFKPEEVLYVLTVPACYLVWIRQRVHEKGCNKGYLLYIFTFWILFCSNRWLYYIYVYLPFQMSTCIMSMYRFNKSN